MPSWHAYKYSSKCVVTFLTPIAALFPSAISWSTREPLILIIANSDATKHAVSAIKTATKIKFTMSN